MTRRDLLALAAAPLAHAAASERPSVISADPEHYHGWPTLVRRRNGELLAV